MTRARLAIGVDFGTESGRVLALDLATGEEVGVVEVRYAHGVIDDTLEVSGERLEPDWALQDPRDYLEVLEQGVPGVLAAAGADPSSVVGLGIAFTSCTVLPVAGDGTPLCELDPWRKHPHAWVKLWKHHAAQPYADRMNEVAERRGETFLARYGGRLSSEWYFPKLLEVHEEDPEVFGATEAFVEATDWIVWQLTGHAARARCTAGYKACWSASEGLPRAAYFEAVSPGFSRAAGLLGTSFLAPGSRAGTVRPMLAERLGLHENVAVAVGNVDSFVSVPGCGIRRPGAFVMVIGTSICDMVVDPSEVLVPGITGVVEDGILPGLYGYEAGQPAVGDMFAWYVERLLGASAASSGRRYGDLETAAAALEAGSTGLVALDWWNGNRAVLGDADLSGVVAGLSLSTTPVELYRALLESVAYGTRTIVENFVDHGVALHEIVACGGIADRSPLLLQLIADTTKLAVSVPGSSQVPARGAALFGAVAAGEPAGGFRDIETAVTALSPGTRTRYRPSEADGRVYDEVYGLYQRLHDTLGREHVAWLHRLKALRRAAGASRDPAGLVAGGETTSAAGAAKPREER